MKTKLLLPMLFSAVAFPALAEDFGLAVDQMLAAQAPALFGIQAPLAASAAESAEEGYRTLEQTEADQVALASGLTATFLTRQVADSADMMAFYPLENPTHAIMCIEGDREEIAPGKMNPGVQAVALADGTVTTLVRGTQGCDGIRTTPWGTVVFTEEEDDGAAYEMIDVLAVDNVSIIDRATGELSDGTRVVKRTALPTMAWEGFVVMAEGVVIGGDELRPGTANPDADGGSIFKFIPASPFAGGMIDTLEASPLAAGSVYAMQVQCVGGNVQFGQGCETGNATWLLVNAATVRADADAAGATGYYRPEDMHDDPTHTGEGVRFCWTDTGNEGAQKYSEVMCAVDTDPLTIAVPDAEGAVEMTTSVVRFIEGDTDFNSVDNLAFQPGTGILYVIEDHPNGDIWACLPDGTDRDLKSDGCIKMLSVMDTSAEPTGFTFAADGLTAYVNIQHSDDTNVEKVDDYGTDDVLVITGFKAPM